MQQAGEQKTRAGEICRKSSLNENSPEDFIMRVFRAQLDSMLEQFPSAVEFPHHLCQGFAEALHILLK